METFSENTLQILKNAGWFQGRICSTAEYEAYLVAKYEAYPEKEDYYLNDVIRTFLQEFGGLTLKVTRTKPFNCVRDIPIGTTDGEISLFTLYDDFEHLTKGEAIVPIGLDHSLTIWMSYSGTVYGSLMNYFCWVADNGKEAIEKFCAFHSGLKEWDGVTLQGKGPQ